MKSTNYTEELAKAEVEIEELSMQLADMLGATLHFAGVPKDNIPKAVEAYLDALDEVYAEEEDENDFGFEEIVTVVNYLKSHKKELFKPNA